MTVIDWDVIEAEAIDLLSRLIRLDTSNPPGNERIAAELVRDVLVAEGIGCQLLESSPGRANLIARLDGVGPAGPLLLLSHLDVAPADTEGWRFPPFAGTVADGFVWGRGAVDMKHIVVASVISLLLARRTGASLQRDLVVVSTADEESAGESGAGWLWRTHPDLVRCEVAVSEGSDAFTFRGRPYLLLATGQKGWVTIDLERSSRARHSSIATDDNCLLELGPILVALAQRRFPYRQTWSARSFVEGLAGQLDGHERATMLELLDAERHDAALAALDVPEELRERLAGAFRAHVTPTEVEGGEWRWAIPAQVRLGMAGRVMPGETRESWLADLTDLMGPLGEHRLSDFETGIETPESATFEELQRLVLRHAPDAVVVASLAPGSDLQHPSRAGAETYGFFPLYPEPGVPSIWDLAHSVDERISIGNLMRCVRNSWDLVCVRNGLPLD